VWHKFGHDRTYLKSGSGIRLGWVDNATGVLTVEMAEHRSDLEAWLASHTEAVSSGTAPDSVEAPAEEVSAVRGVVFEPPAPVDAPTSVASLDWTDLSGNRPGQAAREQAEAHLERMRSKSKFGTFLLRTFDAKTDERAWRVGAKGEESVGSRLNRLTEHGWHVLHAVPIGTKGSDIDHLLIGPGGVWTINTKNHPGKKVWVAPHQVRVGGQVVPYLRNSTFEADRVRKILTKELGWEPFVKAALVFLTGTLIPDVTIKKMPESVLILDRMEIPGAFKRSTGRLTSTQVIEVFDVARRSTTWQ